MKERYLKRTVQNLGNTIELLEYRQQIWEQQLKDQKAKGKKHVDVCLVASVVNNKEDIQTLKRASRIVNDIQAILFAS